MADARYELYNNIFKNHNIKTMNMMSLYDYLGHAAGPELGQQVAAAAAANYVKFETREVSTKTYTGKIMLYPKSFLDNFFGGVNEGTNNNKQLLHG
jgi:hypothetical protein